MPIRTVGDFIREYSGSNIPELGQAGTKLDNVLVGIELELEGFIEAPDINRNYWNVISDNSLRNSGLELVSAGPVGGIRLERALDDLEECLSNTPNQISERCSTHIHINVCDMNLKQLMSFLLLSTMFEKVLFGLFGSNRRSNTFCKTLDVSENSLRDMTTMLSCKTLEQALTSMRFDKYASVSLNRIKDLGTVEFRMFKPILRAQDYERVLNFLFAIRREAMSLENFEDIITFKKAHSLSELFTRLFPDEAFSNDYEDDLESGVQVVNDLLLGIELTAFIQERSESLHIAIGELHTQLDEVQRGV